jgi:hypothetical protein
MDMVASKHPFFSTDNGDIIMPFGMWTDAFKCFDLNPSPSVQPFVLINYGICSEVPPPPPTTTTTTTLSLPRATPGTHIHTTADAHCPPPPTATRAELLI